MSTHLEPLLLRGGHAAQQQLPRLAQALTGKAPILPYGPQDVPRTVPDDPQVPDDLALVIGTSGSTGTPKLAMLTAPALAASADATHQRLGGPGQWLLVLPPHHIAGLQVLFRSLRAETDPVTMDLGDGFTPAGFVAAARRMTGERRYVSLVPTQLGRLLDDAGAARALREFHGVLVGGAALPPRLRQRAQAEGVAVTATYGMSETAGGCVYDGLPLPGVGMHADDDGRVHLSGPVLAAGYLGRPDLTTAAFTEHDGVRWFGTDDLGQRDKQGRWHITGRIDDLIITGGLKVAPRLVEEAVADQIPGVQDCVVVGVADPEWGQAVTAALVMVPGQLAPTLDDLRSALRETLPDHALPRRVVELERIPVRGPGKPDRRAVARAVQQQVGGAQ